MALTRKWLAENLKAIQSKEIFTLMIIARLLFSLLPWIRSDYFLHSVAMVILLDLLDGAFVYVDFTYRTADWVVDFISFGSLFFFSTHIPWFNNYTRRWLVGNAISMIVSLYIRDFVTLKPPILPLVSIPLIHYFNLPIWINHVGFFLWPILVEYPIHLWQTGKWGIFKTREQRIAWLIASALFQLSTSIRIFGV